MKLPKYSAFSFFATLIVIIIFVLIGLYNWLVYHSTFSFFSLAVCGIPMLIFNFFIYRRNRRWQAKNRT